MSRVFERDGSSAGQTDAALLARFAADRDEAAFAALVERHGPMVLDNARSVVRSVADAEDVYQATFLILARRARSIRAEGSVAGWLHRVARRVALRVVADAAARRGRERHRLGQVRVEVDPADRPEVASVAAESHRLLHEEVARLPDRYRAAVVLCDLEGLTRATAAQALGCPAGTVAGRLARGRQLLRDRLVRRGGDADAWLGSTPRLAPVPIGWGASAVRAALAGPIVGSASRIALAERVVGAMTLGSISRIAAVLTVVLAVGGGVGWWTWTTPARPVAGVSPPDFGAFLARQVPPPPEPSPRPLAVTEPFNFRGRVLGPDGAPVPGARVYRVDLDRTPTLPPEPNAMTDADGRFEFASTRYTVASGIDSPALDDPKHGLRLLATAPGRGVGFVRPQRLGSTEIPLPRDDEPIRGRVVDRQGQPVANARIKGLSLLVPRVTARNPTTVAAWLAWVHAAEAEYARFYDQHQGNDPQVAFGRLPRGFRWNQHQPLSNGFDTALEGADLTAILPTPAITDGAGRFEVTGVGHDQILVARIEAPSIAAQTVYLITARTGAPIVIGAARWGTGQYSPPHPVLAAIPWSGPGAPTGDGIEPSTVILGADATLIGQPGRSVTGVVRDRATGRPLTGVEVGLELWWNGRGYLDPHCRTTSGPDGRYRLDGLADHSVVLLTARPGPEIPWLALERGVVIRAVPGPGAPPPVAVDFELTRGVWAEGRVTDAATGEPRSAARVQGWAFADNPLARRDDPTITLVEHHADTGDDGRFRLLVCPGPGLITAQLLDSGQLGLGNGQAGIGAEAIVGHRDPTVAGALATLPGRLFPRSVNTIVALDPAPEAGTVAVALAIHPVGPSNRGTIRVDP